MLTKAYVTRILSEKDSSSDLLVATAVEFVYNDQKETRIVTAKKEVIVSAGFVVASSFYVLLINSVFRALKTPQILEFSGIGRPDVLSKIGVELKLDLPVGENVQEHAFTGVTFRKFVSSC